MQMSFQQCVFYYWSDEEWDSCDKFREVATPILNPQGLPDLLEWRASDTQVFMKGRQDNRHRLINVLDKTSRGAAWSLLCHLFCAWSTGEESHLGSGSARMPLGRSGMWPKEQLRWDAALVLSLNIIAVSLKNIRLVAVQLMELQIVLAAICGCVFG